MARRPTADVRIGPWSARRTTRPLDKEGRPYWRCWATVDGKTVSRYLRAHLPELAVTLANLSPELPGPRQRAAEETPAEIRTVQDLVELYLPYCRTRRAAETYRRARSKARVLKRSWLWRQPVEALLELDVLERYAADRLGRGVSPVTVSHDFIALQAAWRWARRRRLVPDTAVYPPELPDARPRRNRYTPSAEEVAKVVAWLEAKAQEPRAATWPAPALRLLWAFGARVSGVMTLEWDVIDLEAGTLSVTGKKRTRLLPIPAAALEVLQQLRETPGRPSWRGKGPQTVNPRRVLGVETHPATLWRWITLACDALEQPRWSAHGLRRAMDDRLWRERVEPGVLSATMGHSAVVSVAKYRQPSTKELAEALGEGRLPPVELQ